MVVEAGIQVAAWEMVVAEAGHPAADWEVAETGDCRTSPA